MSYGPMSKGGSGIEYTDGSTFIYRNCTYDSGGVYRQGNIVTVALAIATTVSGDSSSNPPLIQVNNIPYVPREIDNFCFRANGPWKSHGKDCDGYIQRNLDLSQNGLRLSVANPNITTGTKLKICFTFVCE